MGRDKATQKLGLLLLVAGAGCDSLAGLFTRLIGSDGFTISAGRGLIAHVLILGILIWRDGWKTPTSIRNMGWPGLAIVGLSASAMLSNVLSITYTSVANFYMIFATAPFVAAMAARLFLGERIDLATALASLAGFGGIGVMMLGEAGGGGLLGNGLALACVGLFATVILIMRRWPDLDILPITAVNVLVAALIALPFAHFETLHGNDFGILLLFGLVQMTFGNLLIFAAMKRIPAAQSGLLGILNGAFAPLWVLVFLGEWPSTATLIGGSIILAATALHIAWSMRRVA
jgi:drug/metabolite transporter (DMT)-like permease